MAEKCFFKTCGLHYGIDRAIDLSPAQRDTRGSHDPGRDLD